MKLCQKHIEICLDGMIWKFNVCSMIVPDEISVVLHRQSRNGTISDGIHFQLKDTSYVLRECFSEKQKNRSIAKSG